MQCHAVVFLNPPPRVQRGHVRRPGHSPQRTVSDDRRRGKHDEDCSDSNCGGGLGLRRGCDRRMRSSSLARSRDVPCSGRRKRHIRISETSTWISTRILCKSALLGGLPSGGGLSRRAVAGGRGPGRTRLSPYAAAEADTTCGSFAQQPRLRERNSVP